MSVGEKNMQVINITSFLRLFPETNMPPGESNAAAKLPFTLDTHLVSSGINTPPNTILTGGKGAGSTARLDPTTAFFCAPKCGVPYKFPSANRSKGQVRLDCILTKQADRRLILCVNVRRPPLEAPESDHNLVYVKVRIPRRSAPNQRKRDSTKEAPKLVGLRQLMTDPNLRCQVANAMVAALPPIPDGTCISDIAIDMADVMLSTAAELVPRFKRPRGAQGWCAGPGVEAEMNAA